MSGHGGHIDPSNKRVALLIAAGLAFSETLGAVGMAFILIGYFAPTAAHLF